MFIVINFLLKGAFAASHNFGYVVFPFSFKVFFNFPFDFFFDPLVVQECVF